MNKIFQFVFSTFNECFEYINPYLSNYYEFSKFLLKEIKTKENNNVQFNFDVKIDNLIKNKIREFSINGKIFSEESGFFDFGRKKEYKIVYDPFCNSSLASKMFHESAIGISIFTYNYDFITSAILDYQTGILAIVEDKKTNFYQIQSKKKIFFNNKKRELIEDSWIVLTIESQYERKSINKIINILKKAKRIIVSSGHIYWLKLATGTIDAYLDPFGGERLYEMFASTVAFYNGCIISDKSGYYFDPVKSLEVFENNQNYIYYPVAATNKKLYQNILESIF